MKKLFLLMFFVFGNVSLSNANVDDNNVIDVLDSEKVKVADEDIKLLDADEVDGDFLVDEVDAVEDSVLDASTIDDADKIDAIDDDKIVEIAPDEENLTADDKKLSERLSEQSQNIGEFNDEFDITTAFSDGGVNFLANIIKTSLNSSDSIKSAKSLRDSKYSANRELYNDVFPEINLIASDVVTKTGLKTETNKVKTENDSTKLEYKHNIFKSGSDVTLISAAKSLNSVANAEFDLTKNQVAYDIVKSVYDISLYRSYISNKDVEIRSYQRQYDKIKVKFDKKTASKIDFLEALTALNTAKEEKRNLQVELRSYIDNYKRLTGKDTYPDNFGNIYSIDSLRGRNVNSLIKVALGNSPSIKMLASYSDYYKKVRRSENLKHLPKVDFVAYVENSKVNDDTVKTETKYTGVTVTIPLINKFSNFNKASSNKKMQSSYKRSLAYEKLRVKQDVETYYREFMQNDSYANSLYSMAAVKKLQYNKRVIKYVKGLISIDEVIEAKKDEVEILNKVEKAKYDRSLSYWKLVKELGIIVVK